MANAIHQCLSTYVDISSNENQLTTARRPIDQLYKHNTTERYSIILLETEDLSDSNVPNKDFLQYAEKYLPTHINHCKYMCPIKYSTDDGFDGNGFKHLLMTLSESSRKSGHSIIRKGY